MKYSNEELKEIQRVECAILEDVDKFLKENNIEYFMIGGTALGAERHKGFIPWDDDIDIGMMREDYERFLKFSSDALGDKYVIASRNTEKNCPFPYPKIRKKGTEFIEYSNFGTKGISTGIYIDVFPFDKVPKNEKLYKRQFKNVQFLSRLYVLQKTKKLSMKPVGIIPQVKAIIKLVSYYLLKIIPDMMVYNMLNVQMKKYNKTDSDKYSCLLFPKMYTEYANEKTLYPLKDYKFEHLIIKGPNDMDTYLTNHYGDYMELPPEEKRVGHKPYRIKL